MTAHPQDTKSPTVGRAVSADRPNLDVVGMWVTADGDIRQELLPNGRYDEARGDRASAYTVTGAHLSYLG